MKDVADRQVLSEIARYNSTLNMFCGIMSDLGLFTLMKKCQEFHNDHNNDDDTRKNEPVRPTTTNSTKDSTPFHEPPTKNEQPETTAQATTLASNKTPRLTPKQSSPVVSQSKKSASSGFEVQVTQKQVAKMPKPSLPAKRNSSSSSKADVTKFKSYYQGNNTQDWRIAKSIRAGDKSEPNVPSSEEPKKFSRKVPKAVGQNPLAKTAVPLEAQRSRSSQPPEEPPINDQSKSEDDSDDSTVSSSKSDDSDDSTLSTEDCDSLMSEEVTDSAKLPSTQNNAEESPIVPDSLETENSNISDEPELESESKSEQPVNDPNVTKKNDDSLLGQEEPATNASDENFGSSPRPPMPVNDSKQVEAAGAKNENGEEDDPLVDDSTTDSCDEDDDSPNDNYDQETRPDALTPREESDCPSESDEEQGASADILSELRKLNTACVSDADASARKEDSSGTYSALKLLRGLRHLNPGHTIMAGVARTIQCTDTDDGLAVLNGLSNAQKDDVLVVNTNNSEKAVAGEIMCAEAARLGVTGIVVGGAMRESAYLTAYSTRVRCWSKTVSPVSGTLRHLGKVDVPIVCGEAEIQPGQILMGDDDGILVGDRASFEQILPIAREYHANGQAIKDALGNGGELDSLVKMKEHLENIQKGKPSSLIEFVL